MSILNTFITGLLKKVLTDALIKKVRPDILKKIDELEKLAHTDYLTGLPNRSGRENATNKEDKLSAIGLDIDNFKAVNDTYGHKAGDVVLQILGQRLQHLFRAGDAIVSREGGEEFSIILANMDKKSVIARAEQVRAVIANTKFAITSELSLEITASIGVAYSDFYKSCTIERLMEKADIAMYESKTSGKNCVTFYESNMEEENLLIAA